MFKTINDRYFICDVHLPNSEDFDGKDDTSLSVALGFTAHMVQMISYIINIPLRYPIINLGSRSKIVDHIIDQLPVKNRELVSFFVFFSRPHPVIMIICIFYWLFQISIIRAGKRETSF